ncbi:GntR family transcriptional regulator [Halioxenophilus sp. WMMB6]|uniref:GntR family transcriptional regulator n=1 Tax=Halioxenophilus sp. WMMB6 TaxID=3073815 RepID=UPI00295EFC8A|nr:GntR family transcriptional regulator [Halioxenophilus sp. WMMB6]
MNKPVDAKPASSSKSSSNLPKSGSDDPLYLQLARTLKNEIVSGKYPVGSLLPTEDNLCERFSVSRYTVREALRILRDDGLVSSRRGAGTLVIPPSSNASDIHQVMSINDLVAFASDTHFVINPITMIKIDDKQSGRTGLPLNSEWLQVSGYRHGRESSTPVCWTEYYINRDFAAVGRLLQRQSGPIFPLIEDMFGLKIAEVQQQISAALITAELAEVLKVEAGSPALIVRRTYKTSDDKVAQVTINVHPASRYQHSMTMRRVKA